jgi:hypothetical protein
MLTWANLILAALRLVAALAAWARDKRLLAAGEDAAIGRAARDMLATTAWGQEIGARIDAMDDARLDELADALGHDPSRRG